ncbi:MAG: AraC family transcriptional regulator [Bacteroidota bacterium]
MKPIFEKITTLPNQSIFIRQEKAPQLDMPYHYHPELELTLTEKRQGTKFIGSSIESIEEYEVAVLGGNLPHCWVGENPVHPESRLTLVQFTAGLFGEQFMALPELANIKTLFIKAKQGMLLHGQTKYLVADKMLQIMEADPLRRLMILFDILIILSETSEYRLLSQKGFIKQFHSPDHRRLNEVYNFIVHNFKGNISLEEAAKVANLSETAFCRYFKQRTTKTFKEVVNEMRITYVSDLILKGKLSSTTISQIAREAGFNNISNFNRQFKKIKGVTPAQLAKEFREKAIREPRA